MNKDMIKYLGIDWGESRIGLALGDSEAKLATPFNVVGSVDDIEQVIKEENISVVVLGKPIKMSGDEKLSDEFNKFIDILKSKIEAPIKLIDERLSSKAADALAGDRKINPPSSRNSATPRHRRGSAKAGSWAGLRRARAPRDAVAAMLILQSYLDKT